MDVEGGYTDDPKEVAKKLKPVLNVGAVGINIEDGEGTPELLVRKIEQVRTTAESVGVRLFINARTDVYLNEFETPESRIEETISRAARYREAGADGIFIPALFETAAIKSIYTLSDKEFMSLLKEYFYNNPNRSLANTAPTLGVYVRDKYLEEHPEIIQ